MARGASWFLLTFCCLVDWGLNGNVIELNRCNPAKIRSSLVGFGGFFSLRTTFLVDREGDGIVLDAEQFAFSLDPLELLLPSCFECPSFAEFASFLRFAPLAVAGGLLFGDRKWEKSDGSLTSSVGRMMPDLLGLKDAKGLVLLCLLRPFLRLLREMAPKGALLLADFLKVLERLRRLTRPERGAMFELLLRRAVDVRVMLPSKKDKVEEN